MSSLLRANLKVHARRYLATGIAVAISTAFILTFLALGAGMKTSIIQFTNSEYEGAALVITAGHDFETTTSEGGDALSELVPTIEKVEGAGQVAEVRSTYLTLDHDGKRASLSAEALKPTPFFAPVPDSGTLPQAKDEIAIDSATAERIGAKIGDSVEASVAFGDDPSTRSVTITGIVKKTPMQAAGAVLLPDGLSYVAKEYSQTSSLLVSSDMPGSATDDQAFAERVRTALSGVDVKVATADSAREEALAQIVGESTNITVMFLLFPVLSLIVAAIVVASTFQVLLTQRIRELALLRTLGTTRAQVRRLLLKEALLVGVVSSLIGLAFGTLIGWGVLWGFGILQPLAALTTTASPTALGATFAVGTLMTVLSGLRPALAMGRLSPMEALVSADSQTNASPRSHRVLVSTALVIAALGCVGMGVGLSQEEAVPRFLIAFASGMVVLVAMMIAGIALIPLLAKGWGLLGRGMVARVARGNVLRNPGRTAATGIAIAIGVTLITMMSVGAASTKATLEAEVYSHFPYDLIVSSTSSPLDTDDLEQITALEGIDAALIVRGEPGTISVEDSSAPGTLADAEGGDMFIQGLPDLSPVAHAPVTPIPNGVVAVSSDIADDGTPVRLCVKDANCATFTAKVDKALKDVTGQVNVSAESLKKLDPHAPIVGIIVKTSSTDIDELNSRLLSLDHSYHVWGPALERQMYTREIDTALAIVVGLLAISVLVALVGVTNTLSLSVAERTRENGLLRALGMTKRSVRRMLAFEALIIALAGATLGIILGIGFGIVGTYALPIESIDATIISIPWGILATVVVSSILAALLASWWPGRRAARTSPSAALESRV